MESIKEKTADEMFEELGYEKIDLNDEKYHYYNDKKDKELTFMNNNCYSQKRLTKDEEKAMIKKLDELRLVRR